MADHLRILELRERVASGGAPYLYAQLAEEYRRARDLEEAVACCRSCLERFPHYLSIRVVLGRALAEMGRLDEAAGEFETVLSHAPDNLTATRDLAEIELRRGRTEAAVTCYQRALALFRDDTDLEARVSALLRQLERPGDGDNRERADIDRGDLARAGEPGVDFDAVLTSLGASGQPLPPLMEMLLTRPTSSVLQSLANVRTHLTTELDEPLPTPAAAASAIDRSPSSPPLDDRSSRTIAALEHWLGAAHRLDVARRRDAHADRPA